jgi:hypothetical protein
MLFFVLHSLVQAEEPVDVKFRMMMRPSVFVNPDFNNETQDTYWDVQQSVRMIATGKWDGVVVRMALNDGRVWGSEESISLSKEINTALYEGYVQVGTPDNKSSWLRIGRQEIVLYDSRHFHHGGWNIHGRTFDAIRYHRENEKLSYDLTGMVWKQANSYETTCSDTTPDNGIDDCAGFTTETVRSNGEVVFLANGEAKINEGLVVQPYVITLRQDSSADNPTRDRLVVGPSLRLQGKPTESFSYSLDGSYQFGRATADVSHEAWMAAAKLNYKKDNFGSSIWFEENSGDGNANDDVDNNFEPYYGAFHKFRGFADKVGPINSRDIGLGTTLKMRKNLSAKVDVHYFQLSNPEGTWYSSNRTPIGTAAVGNEDSTLGQEIDLLLTYKPIKGVKLNTGYSVFRPDGAGAELTGNDPMHFAYLWMIVNK